MVPITPVPVQCFTICFQYFPRDTLRMLLNGKSCYPSIHTVCVCLTIHAVLFPTAMIDLPRFRLTYTFLSFDPILDLSRFEWCNAITFMLLSLMNFGKRCEFAQSDQNIVFVASA